VRAVEEVAIPVIVGSTDPRPTLGTVLSRLRDDLTATPPSFEVVIPDRSGAPATVLALKEMVELLWYGHRSRHAGAATSRPNRADEAEAAIVLAMTLVHWFSKGWVRLAST
jgi:hypothetical protein